MRKNRAGSGRPSQRAMPAHADRDRRVEQKRQRRGHDGDDTGREAARVGLPSSVDA